MGVFSLFRRKSKDGTDEVSAAAAVTEDRADPADGAGTPEEPEVSDAGSEVAEASEAPTASGDATAAAGPAVTDGTVEIPKQQSAEEAADSGAGEGART